MTISSSTLLDAAYLIATSDGVTGRPVNDHRLKPHPQPLVCYSKLVAPS